MPRGKFAHANEAEGNKWVMRGNWVFKPEVTSNISQPFIEIGWLKGVPAQARPCPNGHPGSSAAAKLELGQPAPGAPPVPVKTPYAASTWARMIKSSALTVSSWRRLNGLARKSLRHRSSGIGVRFSAFARR